jgi:hypothetical protein
MGPEDLRATLRGLPASQRLTVLACDNQMTDSGAKANRSEVMRASALGLYLFPGRCAQSGADKRRKCL